MTPLRHADYKLWPTNTARRVCINDGNEHVELNGLDDWIGLDWSGIGYLKRGH
jgi:hypothetical protein